MKTDKELLLKKLRNLGFETEILQAFEKVDRSLFVPEIYSDFSYRDMPLPIGEGQTISQPYTVAFMLQLLNIKDGQKILEVGSGSGYVLALMSMMAPNSEIYGTERISPLVLGSQKILSGNKNIKIFHTPTGIGLSDFAPYDRILVSAAADQFPEELLSQLSRDGTVVCPVRNSIIRIIKRKGEAAVTEEYPGFSFVPLIG